MTKRAVDKTKRWVRNQVDKGGWGVYGLFRSLHFHFPWNNKFIWEISMSTALSSFEEGGGQWKGGAQLVWFSVTSVLIVGSWSHHNWKEIHKIILDCNRLPRNNKFIWGDVELPCSWWWLMKPQRGKIITNGSRRQDMTRRWKSKKITMSMPVQCAFAYYKWCAGVKMTWHRYACTWHQLKIQISWAQFQYLSDHIASEANQSIVWKGQVT